MEGFKTSPKMQCFKEGGAVKYKSRHSEKSEMKEDIAQDKAIVKKAVKMHDVQQHEGEKTDLAKLKKGGRMKKEGGCVGRYKSGGGVSYGAKKTKEDRKEIAAIKRMKDGGKTKKYADGGLAGQGAVSDAERGMLGGATGQGAISETERLRLLNRAKNRAMLSPSQQRELDAQEAAAASGRGMGSALDSAIKGGVSPMSRKKGGTIKKYAEGGSLKPVDKEENPGLAKLPTNVRNKMGYAKKGGKVC